MDRVLTITQVSHIIKQYIEGNPELTSIWIKGEISNITYHSSGHIYFTLKDSNAVLQAAFFKNANKYAKFRLEEGMSVIAFGSITVYERRGSYQLIVNQVMLEGIGELQKQIEQLKKKLSQEGLFDAARKKRIPLLPRRVGIVTSPTGAAFRDILKVALRRFPSIEIILAPAKVQGDAAAKTIVRAIQELNKPEWNIDVIIAGRGGGSFEDLMPFNEEAVVRAYAESRVPIISAVGHQIDHPLSDDVADAAAPTPSAAAEYTIPVRQDLIDDIDNAMRAAFQALKKKLEEAGLKLTGLMKSRVFQNPREMVFMREMLLDDLKHRMVFSLKDLLNILQQRYAYIPDLNKSVKRVIQEKTRNFKQVVQSLDQLSPLKVMARGYSVTCNQGGDILRSVHEVSRDELIKVFLTDGSLECMIREIREGESFGE